MKRLRENFLKRKCWTNAAFMRDDAESSRCDDLQNCLKMCCYKFDCVKSDFIHSTMVLGEVFIFFFWINPKNYLFKWCHGHAWEGNSFYHPSSLKKIDSVSLYDEWIRMYTRVSRSLVCCFFSQNEGGFDTHIH